MAKARLEKFDDLEEIANLKDVDDIVFCDVDLTTKLSKEEMKKLNPVVTRGSDKIKCGFEKCGNLIYPPKKLCDSSRAFLELHAAKRIKNNGNSMVDEKK